MNNIKEKMEFRRQGRSREGCDSLEEVKLHWDAIRGKLSSVA